MDGDLLSHLEFFHAQKWEGQQTDILTLTLVNKGAQEMGQLIKCLPHKQEDLGLSLGLYVKRPGMTVHACSLSGEQPRQGDSWSLPSKTGGVQISSRDQKISRRAIQKVSVDLCLLNAGITIIHQHGQLTLLNGFWWFFCGTED